MHEDKHRALLEGVLSAPGSTSRERRQGIISAARAITEGREGEPELEQPVRGYVEQLAERAHTIDDQAVERLREAGHKDDALFEITVAAAVGAGVARLERAITLLEELEAP